MKDFKFVRYLTKEKVSEIPKVVAMYPKVFSRVEYS